MPVLSLDDLTPDAQLSLRSDLRIALIGGVFSALLMGAISFAVGGLSGYEAQALLESAMPTTRFLCSAVMTASATTLALMLTLLSMSLGSEAALRGSHYERIRQIAFVDVVAFIGATVLLVAHIVPVGESGGIPMGWYDAIFYGAAVIAALLGGVLVAVMLLLYAAVRDLITTFGPGDATPLFAEDDARQEAEQAERDAQHAEDEAEQAQDDAATAEAEAKQAQAEVDCD